MGVLRTAYSNGEYNGEYEYLLSMMNVFIAH